MNLSIDPETNRYLIKFDASSLKYSSCLRRFWRAIVDGYCSPVNPIDIEFGQAIHIFTKELHLSSVTAALTKAQNYFKDTPMASKKNKGHLTVEYLSEACLNYYQEFHSRDTFIPIKIDGVPLVEKNFAINILSTKMVDYILCGTIDAVGRIGERGCIMIRDYKSTGSYYSEDFFQSFRLSHQLLTYHYGLQKLIELYPNSEFTQELNRAPINSQIVGIFVPSGSRIDIKVSPIIEFPFNLHWDYTRCLFKFLEKFNSFFESNIIPPKEGVFNGSCSPFAAMRCPFFVPCTAPDERSEEVLLDKNFMKIPYDPLNLSNKHKIVKELMNKIQQYESPE